MSLLVFCRRQRRGRRLSQGQVDSSYPDLCKVFSGGRQGRRTFLSVPVAREVSGGLTVKVRRPSGPVTTLISSTLPSVRGPRLQLVHPNDPLFRRSPRPPPLNCPFGVLPNFIYHRHLRHSSLPPRRFPEILPYRPRLDSKSI